MFIESLKMFIRSRTLSDLSTTFKERSLDRELGIQNALNYVIIIRTDIFWVSSFILLLILIKVRLGILRINQKVLDRRSCENLRLILAIYWLGLFLMFNFDTLASISYPIALLLRLKYFQEVIKYGFLFILRL